MRDDDGVAVPVPGAGGNNLSVSMSMTASHSLPVIMSHRAPSLSKLCIYN